MEYLSIQKSDWVLYKDKGSKFWGKCFHSTNKEDIKRELSIAKEKYPDATHWCYAVVYDYPQNEQMSQDNGEPNGTAGLPILRKIQSSGLLNCLVIVVRYYGGTKLGTRGLIEAYGGCAEESLAQSKTLKYILTKTYTIKADFNNENDLHIICKRTKGEILDTEYTASSVVMRLRLPESQETQFWEVLKEFYKVEVVESSNS